MITVHVNFDLTPTLSRDVRKKAGQVIGKLTEDAAADYKNRVTDNSGKSGKIYKKKSGVEHQASAPGQAPANDAGLLADNITFEVDEENLTGTVQAFQAYAPVLELGGENIEKRPALQPAIDAIAEVLPDALAAAVNSVGR